MKFLREFADKIGASNFWDQLNPSQQKIGSILGISAAVLIGMWLVVGTDKEAPKRTKENVQRSILSANNTRELGMDSLAAENKTLQKKIEQLEKRLERTDDSIGQINQRRGNDPDITREIGVIRHNQETLAETAKFHGWEIQDLKDGKIEIDPLHKNAEPRKAKVPEDAGPGSVSTQAALPASTSFAKSPDVFAMTPPTPQVVGPATKAEKPIPKMRTIQGANDGKAGEVAKPIKLPTGTLFSITLLNGLDAPAGRSAKNDPFPVLARINDLALLPNEFTADLRECFVTSSGYGDLSSERAYLRGEKISCIDKRGQTYEGSFPAYMVGEDNTAGVRGPVVHKAGQLIAKTALAGFASGVATAFDSNPVPVVQTSNVTSTPIYQKNFTEDAFNHGVSSGATEALTKLADYFMDLADQIFPVIEIKAGREVNMVATGTVILNPIDVQPKAATLASRGEK